MQKEDFSDFNYTFFKDNEMLLKTFERTLSFFPDILKEWGEDWKDFVPAMEKYVSTFADKARKSYSMNPSDSGYNVLNHGDFHIRNLLFTKHEDDKIDDVKFVSFKLYSISWIS